jgi:AmpD protein
MTEIMADVDSMLINSETGLLAEARYCPSSHCDDRPAGTAVDMVVVHNISLPPGQFGTGAIEAFFCGKLDFTAHPYFATIAALRVSAHLLITRQGDIIQFVPFHRRAWHAGESSYQGKTRCNDFSIGIELEGTDDLPYEERQYRQLAAVISSLRQCYPAITKDRIVGHSDIAPVRKTDPGPAFDWNYLQGKLP